MNIRLREILTERGLSIRTFAQQLGVAPNSLPVNDTYKPTLTALQRYATALNVPVVDLVRKPEQPTPYYDGADHTDGCDINELVLRRIKDEMKQRGFSMLALANKIGVSNPSLSHTFKYNKMGIATVEKIANGLGVEAWELMVDGASGGSLGTEAGGAYYGTLQPVRPMVEADPEEPVLNQETQDLFAQYPDGMTPEEMYQMELMQIEEEERRKNEAKSQVVQMQEGVTYVCGNTRITIVNGVMEIRVQDKKAI